MLRLILMVACLVGCAQAQMVVPSSSIIVITGASYAVSFVPGLTGPVRAPSGIRMVVVASEVVCAVPGRNGWIRVSADLMPVQQAKALLHETVHIAQTCDMRELPVDEKIAQAVADLLNSAEGRFVLKELQ